MASVTPNFYGDPLVKLKYLGTPNAPADIRGDATMNKLNFYVNGDYAQFKPLLTKLATKRITVRAGERLQDTNGRHFYYYIEDGLIMRSVLFKSGLEHGLLLCGHDTLTPVYRSEGTSPESTLSLVAIHEAHVLAITHDKIDDLVYNNRDFNHQLIISYQKNIDYLIRKKELLLTSTGLQRLAYYLTCYLDEYEPKDDTVHVSQSLMGSLVVLNPVNTSRNMKKLRELGLISTDRNGIKILKRNKLRELGEIEEITI